MDDATKEITGLLQGPGFLNDGDEEFDLTKIFRVVGEDFDIEYYMEPDPVATTDSPDIPELLAEIEKVSAEVLKISNADSGRAKINIINGLTEVRDYCKEILQKAAAK